MFKNKSIWICLALMISLLSDSQITTHAETMNGYFDQMENGMIVGWGWESDFPNTAVPVHVTITNEQTSQIVGDYYPTAAIHRSDLESSQIGNGCHGFCLRVNWDSLPDGKYLIEGWVGEQKFSNTLAYTKGDIIQADVQDDSGSGNGEAVQPAAANTISLGSFRTTGYCPCRRCNGKWGGRTSTGAVPRSGHTIAVDPRVIPYGTKIMINGVVYTAEDCGGGVKGKHIDVFYDTHSQALRHGLQSQEVFLVQ